MRNLFDQYRQPENQLSHALASVLSMDAKLCRKFIRWLVDFEPPRGAEITVEQQRVPGIPLLDLEEGERRGLPDICIHGESEWCVAIESKVGASLTADQLRRHRQTVGRCFEKVFLVAITAEKNPADLPKDTRHRTWEEVYVWMGEQAERDGLWIRQLRDFMRILESRLVAEGGGLPASLTMFDGIPFSKDHPYNYLEAKLLLRQAMALLRKRDRLLSLGIDPSCVGRSAITGKDSTRIWDYISLKPPEEDGGFTNWPHLTFGIHDDKTEVRVTMPNSIKGRCRRAFRELGEQGFIELSSEIAKSATEAFGHSKAYKPIMKVVHRHYASLRSEAEVDGDMEVDLRTALPESVSGIKAQSHWFEAAYRLLTDKKGCNVQLQMGLNFLHSGGMVQGKNAVETLEKGWLACEPLIRVLLQNGK